MSNSPSEMTRRERCLPRIFLGATLGLVLCGPVFIALLWVMMSSREGSPQSPLVLLAAPIYALMYVVVIIVQVIPPGLILGAIAGGCACVAAKNSRVAYAIVAIVAAGVGAWVGWGFVDTCLEGVDTATDRAWGGMVAATVFAAGNLSICRFLAHRSSSGPS